MFATMKPYAPPPPPGAQPPPLWGDEAHVRALLGDRVTDVVAETQHLRGDRVRRRRGVPRLLQAHLRPDHRRLPLARRRPDRTAALDAALAALGDRDVRDGAMEWEYLLLTARSAERESATSAPRRSSTWSAVHSSGSRRCSRTRGTADVTGLVGAALGVALDEGPRPTRGRPP